MSSFVQDAAVRAVMPAAITMITLAIVFIFSFLLRLIDAENGDFVAFRIVNNAFVAINNVTINTTDYAFILGASDGSSAGNLHIYSGEFHAATSVVSVTKGELVIRDGNFSVDPYNGSYEYLINCIDANYKNGTATVKIILLIWLLLRLLLMMLKQVFIILQ